MIFDENALTKLRSAVKDVLTEKRYIHTVGVGNMASYLGSVIMPSKVNELRAAALLHDVAKELSYDEHVSLVTSSDMGYTDEDLKTKPALHSIAALPVIKRDFPEYATNDVLSAVANHTLGNDGMSLFDEIIYISDYAEEGRTYPACCEVREYLLKNVNIDNNYEDNVKALHIASLSSIEHTIESLTKRNEKINSKTFLTKSYLERLLK